MEEFRCLNCNKKLAEISKRPVFEPHYAFSVGHDSHSGSPLNLLPEPKNNEYLKHLVIIKCARCKALNTF